MNNKIKITKKEVSENFKNVIKVNYCGLQSLLYFKNPNFYNCGVYGWNCDYYIIDNDTIICTGYRPSGNIQPDYNTIRKYEEKADELRSKYSNYDEFKNKMNKLLNKFIETVINNN